MQFICQKIFIFYPKNLQKSCSSSIREVQSETGDVLCHLSIKICHHINPIVCIRIGVKSGVS